MNLSDIKNRLSLLLELQNLLIKKYGENDYNIFVFGSFLTLSYQSGKSDIDLAVYADSFQKYVDISVDIENFFNKYNIPFDLFFIDLRYPSSVYYSALSTKYWLTDYYPERLQMFRDKCKEKVDEILIKCEDIYKSA